MSADASQTSRRDPGQPRKPSAGAGDHGSSERLCDEFEARWKAGSRPRLEEFLAAAPATEQPAMLGDLLALELSYLADWGEDPNIDLYIKRFPQDEAVVVAEFQRRRRRSLQPREGERELPLSPHEPLFGPMAVLTGFVAESILDAAVQQRSIEPTKSLAEILVANEAISVEERQLIEHLCRKHLARRGGDPERSLAALSFAPTVSRRDAPASDTKTSPPSAEGGRAQGTFGDYEILGEIARGGMGVVYKARQHRLNRLVALKMIRSGELSDAAQVKRFYSEAKAAAQLDHPGIVPVYDVGLFNGQHFYSMAFIAGRSLNESVKQEGPLAPKRAAQLMKLIAEAVQFAHDKGVVHRDIKPQNVLLDENAQPRVADFGLAKFVETPSELTASGQVLGTPSYMPPEQAKGALAVMGAASDVYALGATAERGLRQRPGRSAARCSAAGGSIDRSRDRPIPALGRAKTPSGAGDGRKRDERRGTSACRDRNAAGRFVASRAGSTGAICGAAGRNAGSRGSS
jgi:tRNA A-37 threonylcarbamoyl transferase component Bud32